VRLTSNTANRPSPAASSRPLPPALPVPGQLLVLPEVRVKQQPPIPLRRRLTQPPARSRALFQFLGSGTARRPSGEGRGVAACRVPQVGATIECRSLRTARTSGTVLGVELGYARVSTAKQDLDRQVDALTTAGIPTDGPTWTRSPAPPPTGPGSATLLDYARSGDVIVVHTLDRLGRTVRDDLPARHARSARCAG